MSQPSSLVQRGFTLIEVLIAAAITVLGISVILQLFSSASFRTRKVATQSQVILIQKQIYHRLSHLNIAQYPQGKGSIENVNYQWRSELKTKAYPIYNEDVLVKTLSLYLIKVNFKLNQTTQQFQWEQMGWKQKILSD